MDGWEEFLNARMRLIQDALRQGKCPGEIEHLINTSPIQLMLLIERAKIENKKDQ